MSRLVFVMFGTLFLDFLALNAAIRNSKQQSELLAYQMSRFTDSRPFFPKMPKNEMSMISENASAVHKESTLWPPVEYFKKWFSFLISCVLYM